MAKRTHASDLDSPSPPLVPAPSYADLLVIASERTLVGARDYLAENGFKDRKTLRDRKALLAMTIKLSPAEYWALVAIGRKAGINGAGVVGEILRGEREGFAKPEEAGGS